MAVRNVKLSYRDLLGFLKAWDGDLKKGSLFIPAKSFGGNEAAAELRVDLIVPPRWRLGPLDCQVIF